MLSVTKSSAAHWSKSSTKRTQNPKVCLHPSLFWFADAPRFLRPLSSHPLFIFCPSKRSFFQNFCSIFREHLVRFCMCVFVHEGVRASVRVGHIRRPSAEGIFASRELVGRRLSLGLVQFSACLCERMCVCLHTRYVGLRSIASVAPVHPSLPQTINSVIATLRRMHRPKQSAKRKGVIDGGSCCPNEFND